MAALRTASNLPIELPPIHGGSRVLGVVEAMGWYLTDSMGENPIPPTELRAFCLDVGVKLYPEEVVQALAISRAYVFAMAKYRKGGGDDPPYRAPKEA